MKPIRRALVSVSDKNGLIPFAQFLHQRKVQILSTGGTLKALNEAGIPAVPVDEFTGFPEILEGRVKTLHPKIHGGLLFRRDKKAHCAEAKKHGIEPIDLVVVNLYPFEKATADPSVDLETAIENIDIGGPSMLRSAAKNYDAVTVVTDPSDYAVVIADMERHGDSVADATRERLAMKVFERTARYDGMIAAFLKKRLESAEKSPSTEVLPASMDLHYVKSADLRYGENPHQAAAFYLESGKRPVFRQLHGKELSFNNLMDVQAAIDGAREFAHPAAVVIKHNNPCGVAEDTSLPAALERAIECDAMSAFGGIVGINRVCDLATAKLAFERLRFFEVFVAPHFEPAALAFMKSRQNLRLIEADMNAPASFDAKFMDNGLLLQKRDLPLRDRLAAFKKSLRFVTRTKGIGRDIDALVFAFQCVKIVKSNAIVITQDRQTVGIGAGQMSRVDSVEIACSKAGYRTDGGILASDAFFPMPDSIEVAHDHKIRAIIQPGGSLKDAEVIAACDRFGIAMAFTGERHFKH